MNLFKILESYSKVETVISLLAFIVAAALGYLAYVYNAKLKNATEVIRLADSQVKSDLAIALLNAFPSYRIPDLTNKQGFAVVKMQISQKAVEFKSKMNTLRMFVILLFLAICILFASNTANYISNGKNSPVMKGDNNTINYIDSIKRDSVAKAERDTTGKKQ